MLGKIPRPTPAMGVALLALVIAASGAAVAAIPSSDGTITACRDNRSGALRAINAEGGQTCGSRETQLAWKNGITGKVADSDQLDGKDSTDFVSGTGSVTPVDERFSDPDGTGGAKGFSSVLIVPGAQIQATCLEQSSGIEMFLDRTSDVSAVSLWRDDGGADPTAKTLQPDSFADSDSSPVSAADRVIWHGSSAAGTFTAVLFTRYEGGSTCHWSGYVLSN